MAIPAPRAPFKTLLVLAIAAALLAPQPGDAFRRRSRRGGYRRKPKGISSNGHGEHWCAGEPLVPFASKATGLTVRATACVRQGLLALACTATAAEGSAGQLAFTIRCRYARGWQDLQQTTGCTKVSVGDNFVGDSYNNNDGQGAAWLGPWTEHDPRRAIRLADGDLYLSNWGAAYPYVQRKVDLSQASRATLRLAYHIVGNVEHNDEVTVYVRALGGPYHALAALTPASHGVAGKELAFDISAFASAETRVKFRVSRGFQPWDEAFVIDWVTIEFESCTVTTTSAAPTTTRAPTTATTTHVSTTTTTDQSGCLAASFVTSDQTWSGGCILSATVTAPLAAKGWAVELLLDDDYASIYSAWGGELVSSKGRLLVYKSYYQYAMVNAGAELRLYAHFQILGGTCPDVLTACMRALNPSSFPPNRVTLPPF